MGLILGMEDPLEKGMETHPSILAWRIPCTGETRGLQSMESQRVGHDRETNTFTLAKINLFFYSPGQIYVCELCSCCFTLSANIR